MAGWRSDHILPTLRSALARTIRWRITATIVPSGQFPFSLSRSCSAFRPGFHFAADMASYTAHRAAASDMLSSTQSAAVPGEGRDPEERFRLPVADNAQLGHPADQCRCSHRDDAWDRGQDIPAPLQLGVLTEPILDRFLKLGDRLVDCGKDPVNCLRRHRVADFSGQQPGSSGH